MTDTCLFCEAPAVGYCDFALAMVLDAIVPRKGKIPAHPVTSMDAMLSGSYTCDAPFCQRHGKPVGHVCGGGFHESIDHCALHDGQPHEHREPIPLEEIAAMRRSMHATARRATIRAAMQRQAGGA